jgi:hypothetical protein
MKINKVHFKKFFQDLHIYEKNYTKMSSNLIEHAFDFSLFQTFEQQWYFEDLFFLFFIKLFVNKQI